MWNLLDDLDAFYLEHRRCGELDTVVEEERVWIAVLVGIVTSAGGADRVGLKTEVVTRT